MKKKLLIIGIIIIIIGVAGLLFGRAFPSLGVDTKTNNNSINALPMSKELFYRQTLNNCGPYSVMAVLSLVKHKELNPEQLAKEMTWRSKKNLTYPQGLIDLLHKYEISTSEFNLYLCSADQKINWIKNTIDTGKPIILLVETHNIQHYFTVIGYDEWGIMLYDSMQEKTANNPRKTIIDKPDYQGNRYYTDLELLNLWDKGGFSIFFRDWAVVCE